MSGDNVLGDLLHRGPAMMRWLSETQSSNKLRNSKEQRKANDYFELGNKHICVYLLLTGPVEIHAMTMYCVKPM